MHGKRFLSGLPSRATAGGVQGWCGIGAYRVGMQYSARGACASVGVPAKMSSSGVVYCHKTRTQIQILLVFFGGGQRKPMGFGHAARFARMEGKVQAEDFLEGGFFGGECNAEIQFQNSSKECFAPPTQRAQDYSSLREAPKDKITLAVVLLIYLASINLHSNQRLDARALRHLFLVRSFRFAFP